MCSTQQVGVREVVRLLCCSFQSSNWDLCRVRLAYHDVSLVEYNFYVVTGMEHTWNWMMVLKDLLAIMNKGGRSLGKVHYVRIEVSTAFLGIMVVRIIR